MFLIAHRGNRTGKNPDRENHPDYVLEALAEDYDVEIDIWWHEGNYWLGHDAPMFKVPEDFLKNPQLWCHAKSLETVVALQPTKQIHWFWHESDKLTLTNKGCVWTFPGVDIPNAVINQPKDIIATYKSNPWAICADDFSEILPLREKEK